MHLSGGTLFNRSAQGRPPTVRTDKEEGVRVAKLAPDCRTAGGSCGSRGIAQVKDLARMG